MSKHTKGPLHADSRLSAAVLDLLAAEEELRIREMTDKTNWPQWLIEAETRDAVVEITDDGKVIWHSGTWCDGEWLGGTWLDGEWHGGKWHDGEWCGGVWHRGTWRGGEWYNGEWLGGQWYGGLIYSHESPGGGKA
jgi:hypothetical protein